MSWISVFEEVTLDNREWALLIWLAVVLLGLLSKRNLRASLGGILRVATRPVFLLPLAVMLAYVALEVWIGSNLLLWKPDLLKGTIIWAMTSGLVMLFNYRKAAEAQFFRGTIRGAVGATVFVEFFMNLVAFSRFWELLIQPVLTILIWLSLVAGLDENHRVVKKLIDWLLAIIGFLLLWITARTLYATWDQIDNSMVLLEFALPIWLTIGFLPFVYLFSVYVYYDSAFRGVNDATSDWKARLRAKLAILTKLHIKTRDVQAFNWNWTRRIASAPSFIAGRQVVDQFYSDRRAAEQAVIDEREKLERYAGSNQTDESGRRLDRREFKETIAALRYLSTCQMGWYRNHGGHYHADLLDRFGNDFTRHGLPAESGITMKIATDSQAWFAWRRAVTGWCFAIGAGGPPPEVWEYDGPEPPDDVPGKDPCWGERPFCGGANVNWSL